MKILLTGLVIAVAAFGGLLAAALVAIVAVVGFLAQTAFGRKSPPTSIPPPRPRPPAHRSDPGDAIDVTATEIPGDPPAR